MRRIEADPRKTFNLRVPGNLMMYALPSVNLKVGENLRCFRQISPRWSGRCLSVAVAFPLPAIISWPEHCQQGRSMPVTTNLRHSVNHGSSALRGKDEQLTKLHAETNSFHLTYYHFQNLFFSFKLSFLPHIARFCQHSRDNRRQATTRMGRDRLIDRGPW